MSDHPPHDADASPPAPPTLADPVAVMSTEADATPSPMPVLPGDAALDEGESTPAPPPAKRQRRRRLRRKDPTPRVLVIAFCFWMLGSWFTAMQAAALVRPARWMVISSMIAVMALWPVIRLSQWREDIYALDNGSADTRRTAPRLLIDWFCLNILFQTVVWPLQMNAQWRVDQTVWISVTLACWSLMTGAILAMGCRTANPWRRALAAAACLLLLAGEPLLVAFTGPAAGEPRLFLTSPLALLWQLTDGAAHWLHQPWRIQTPVAGVAGLLAWGVVWLSARWMEPSHEPGVLGQPDAGASTCQ